MAVTTDSFRETFPKFSSARFETPSIQFWLDVAGNMLDPSRWNELLDYGTMLFVAHNLAIEAMDAQAGGAGVGQIIGPKTAANVDKVGYSRDPSAAMDPANGHWNLSSYGLRFIQLSKLIGAAAVQIGHTPNDTNQGYTGGWPGVIYGPTPNG